jgi:hypothetical protein
MLLRNHTLTGGAAPARAYIEELMPVILDGTIEPGRVFDRTVSVDQVPDGYRAMAGRDALKVLIRNSPQTPPRPAAGPLGPLAALLALPSDVLSEGP